MAQVHLLSTTPADDETTYNLASLSALQRSAELGTVRTHSLTSDAASADVILFAEVYGAGWHFERVRKHPLTRHYREKCFIFCSNPFAIPFLPGVYTAIGKRWASSRTSTGFYLTWDENEFLTFAPPTTGLPYLFSFMGSGGNAAVRRRLRSLQYPRSYYRETSQDFQQLLHGRMKRDEERSYRSRYADIIKSSKFVLCPRGLSPSTIRVFETMRMGRVPVILSDEWVEPAGPAWGEFSIRVPESEWASIPKLLEEREADAIAMGMLAREQWQAWFSEEVAFHRVVEWCLAIKEKRRIPESLARFAVCLQYLRPFHFRRALRTNLDRLRGQMPRVRPIRSHCS